MQQLMRRQHKLMLQNNKLIFKQYLEMKVIEQAHYIETNLSDTFFYDASKALCVKGYRLIKKNYMNASLVFPKMLVDQSIIFLICTILNQNMSLKIIMIYVRVIFLKLT